MVRGVAVPPVVADPVAGTVAGAELEGAAVVGAVVEDGGFASGVVGVVVGAVVGVAVTGGAVVEETVVEGPVGGTVEELVLPLTSGLAPSVAVVEVTDASRGAPVRTVAPPSWAETGVGGMSSKSRATARTEASRPNAGEVLHNFMNDHCRHSPPSCEDHPKTAEMSDLSVDYRAADPTFRGEAGVPQDR